MKDSGVEWIGEIPEDWELQKAKYNIVVTHGCDPKTEGDVPVYGSGASSFRSCGEFKEGPTVLVGRKGATLHIPHFITGRYWNVDTAFDVKTDATKFSLRYYYYLATSFDYKYYVSQTTLPGMTQSNYVQMKLPVPLIVEQQEIVAYLDTKCAEIDKVVEQTRSTIEEYKKLKQAIITEAVTKGVRGPRPMKPSGVEWIGDIPEEWSRNKVCRVCNLIGSGTTPKFDKYDLTAATIPWIQSGDLSADELLQIKMHVTQDIIAAHSALKVYEAPFIAVAMYGASIGNAAISTINACVNQACCVLSSETFNIRYLYYIVMACKPYFIYQGEGGGQPNISQEKIKQTWLPVPNPTEQQEIAAYLDTKCGEIDRIIGKKEQLIEELGSYKKSLIYEYVTGKKQVL